MYKFCPECKETYDVYKDKNRCPVCASLFCSLNCPTCNSTNVKKVSTASKVVGGAMFGLFSKTARSQFECQNCGYKW